MTFSDLIGRRGRADLYARTTSRAASGQVSLVTGFILPTGLDIRLADR